MDAIIERVERRLPERVRPYARLSVATLRDAGDDRVVGLAAEAAFFALLSLVPMLLALLGAIGFLSPLLGPEAYGEVRAYVFNVPRAFLSPRTHETYRGIAETILAGGRADVISFGFIFALWTGSRAVGVFLHAITRAYDLEDPRPLWRRRLVALGLTVGGTLAGTIVLPALVLGPRLASFLSPDRVDHVVRSVADFAFWPGLVVVVVAALTTLYHVGTPWQTPWLRDLPGAILAMVLWVLGGAGLRAYVAFQFANPDGIYGSLATPLVVLLWLYVLSFAVLLGAELNAEIEKAWPRTAAPRPSGTDDRALEQPGGR